MAKDRIYELLIKYFNGNCTAEEKEELALWIDTFQNEEELSQQVNRVWKEFESKEAMESHRSEEILDKILRGQREMNFVYLRKRVVRRKMLRWTAVAATFIVLISFVYFFSGNRQS